MPIPDAQIALLHPITAEANFLGETFDDEEFYRTRAGSHRYTTRDIPTGIQGHLAFDMQDRIGDKRLFAGVEGYFETRLDSVLGNMCGVRTRERLWPISCHCSRVIARQGQLVNPDTVIAIMGDSGSGASQVHDHHICLADGVYGYFRNPRWYLKECKEALMLIDPKTGLLRDEIAKQIAGLAREGAREMVSRGVRALKTKINDETLDPTSALGPYQDINLQAIDGKVSK